MPVHIESSDRLGDMILAVPRTNGAGFWLGARAAPAVPLVPPPPTESEGKRKNRARIFFPVLPMDSAIAQRTLTSMRNAHSTRLTIDGRRALQTRGTAV